MLCVSAFGVVLALLLINYRALVRRSGGHAKLWFYGWGFMLLNSINRAMGQPDLYPFHIAPGIVRKLDFVIRLLAFHAGRWAPGEGENADLRAMIAALGHGVDLGA